MKKPIFLAVAFSLLVLSGFSQNRSFTGKPIYQILTKRGGIYLGTTTVELFPAIAPLAVNNFDSLVSTQFYDSTAFHRVIPGFMIQGGDPNSRHGPRSTWGMGDPNQPTVPAEFSAAKHVRGTLSAARDTGINSANSQFFICVAPASWLNGQYTVYGRVTSGMDVVDTIVMQPRDSVDNPLVKIEMFVTYIGSNDTLAIAPTLTQPLNNSFGSSSIRVLKWDALSDGIIYHVDVSTDSTFATTYRSVDVGTNLYTVTGLVAGSRYYWRVNTNNGGNVSGYSPVWNFLISGTGIESYAENNQISVTPNPSSGQFLFSNLERENTIEIVDITGRSVLKTTTRNSSCQIDLSDKSKGLYFYCITSQNKKIKQGKIILE
ncbi:MAG TPA: peptidylprolyl isomerase [Bacteroidia bacterium]|nr:peptidylprolyl isomerase [Bacteroidia bacterium]